MLAKADIIILGLQCSPATPTVLPMNSRLFLKMPRAHLPMSSAAMPGSFLSPMGYVIASLPSSPFLGPMPK